MLVIDCTATLLRILESIGYMSISSDDLKHILQLLRVNEDENVVSYCINPLCVIISFSDRLVLMLSSG